jgi:hypothetical protein
VETGKDVLQELRKWRQIQFGFGTGAQPVHPDAARVNSRENLRAHDRKSVMASAERLIEVRHFLATEMQSGRDHCSGVTGADPEYKWVMFPSPTDRNVIPTHQHQ